MERARQDTQRFETALHSFGYYKATVTTTIGGHALDDPALPAIIDAAPADPPLEVAASFELGPRFQLGNGDDIHQRARRYSRPSEP